MAEQLGYEDSALSRWMADRFEPRSGVITQWALLTGVDPEWLRSGTTPGPDPGHEQDDDELTKLTARKRGHGANSVTRAYPDAA
jgi:transcriptional regulator with XRE-family HTH domain